MLAPTTLPYGQRYSGKTFKSKEKRFTIGYIDVRVKEINFFETTLIWVKLPNLDAEFSKFLKLWLYIFRAKYTQL